MLRNYCKYIFICSIIFIQFSCQKAELPAGFLASTKKTNKVPVLEVFTGVECGWCVDGHEIAESLIDVYGNNIVVIDVHAGTYANPSFDIPNFTTAYGEALVSQSNVPGYPSGTVNRVKYSIVQSDGLAMDRNKWTKAASNIRQQKSPVNIGARAVFNAITRELTVEVDLYYLEDGNGENKLNIAIVQNQIVAYQRGADDENNYVHNHMLKDYITGQWGDIIPEEKTVKRSQYSKSFTYLVPHHYNGAVIPPGGGKAIIEDMTLAIFVAEKRENIYTGINVDIEVQ